MSWWKKSVVYQIYPRSFFDTNSDGIGDLAGISQKLDYLQKLGIDVIWLCPIQQSPNFDSGYDISDYHTILAEFGTLEDFRNLINQLHTRKMKLVMDLVVNHTSDQHPWFLESKKSKDNPYRDYYFWRPGKNGAEPSNWGSHFGGSAWNYNQETDEYYLHLFSRHQPDLNWDNPKVRQAVYQIMNFWLEQGVDGFRIDTLNMLSKVTSFPDVDTTEPFPIASAFFLNGPNLLEYLAEMKQQVLTHHDLMTVGETPEVTPEMGVLYTHHETGALNMIFQFEQMQIDCDSNAMTPKWTHHPWALSDLKRITTHWQVALYNQGWNSLFWSNHDLPRSVSRFGNDQTHHLESAKLLATFLLTLQGTPYIYQGDEIGMTNVQFDSIEQYRDIDSHNFYQQQLARGLPPEEILRLIHAKGRDNARTPMQWNKKALAGFSQSKAWIGVNPNYLEINVENALDNPNSIFWHYRDLILLRQQHPVFIDGRYQLCLPDHPQVYAYTRVTDQQEALVLLNFSLEAIQIRLDFLKTPMTLLHSNYPQTANHLEPNSSLHLRAYEANVYLRNGDVM
jgi:oligo-1,6-glucosidase